MAAAEVVVAERGRGAADGRAARGAGGGGWWWRGGGGGRGDSGQSDGHGRAHSLDRRPIPARVRFHQRQRRRQILITQMAELLKDFDMYVPGRAGTTSDCTRRRDIRAPSCRTSSTRRRRVAAAAAGGAPDTTPTRARSGLQSAADLRGDRGQSLQRRQDSLGRAPVSDAHGRGI